MKIVCGMFKISRRKSFLSQCVLKLQNVSLQDVLDACKSAWVQKSTEQLHQRKTLQKLLHVKKNPKNNTADSRIP